MKFPDLKLFIRNLFRNKLYSVITVGGFAVSLTFILLLSMYIRQEMSVDDFQVNKDRIYRMRGENGATWGALVGGQLQDAIPEIKAYTRMYGGYGGVGESTDGKKLPVYTLYADTTFGRMFTFPLKEGRYFQGRKEVVLSLSFSRKMFGQESPLGKVIKLNGEEGWIVVGVVPDFGPDTHFNYVDILANFTALAPDWIGSNQSAVFALYLEEKPGSDLQSKIPWMKAQMKKDFWMFRDNYRKELFLEPLKDVYWSAFGTSVTHTNSRIFVRLLTAIVGMILVLALINYNNLSVARAGFRAKESAVKKLLGSSNKGLFVQYITESIVLCFVAFCLACLLTVLVLPWFNGILDTHISILHHIKAFTLIGTLVAVGCIGILAGLIPAWVITRFNPAEVIKGAFRKKTRGGYGKVLISFQYFVAITLIICTLTVWKQTEFMRNYHLGFNKENVIWLESKVWPEQSQALRSELNRIPGVVQVSYAYGSPLDGGDNNTITNYAGTGKQISFARFEVDSNFFSVLGLQVTPTGVAYDPKGVWLNETAVKAIGAEGLPEELAFFDRKLPVLGVIKDFHIRKLNNQIEPLIVFTLNPHDTFWKVLVKISPENPAGTFGEIKEVYSRFIGGEPFRSGFMDQTIHAWYESNSRTVRLIGYFSVLAIILSMMGILAMATYFIQQRVKEIGVRRVSGATIAEILAMLMGSFMKWIALAFGIACPVAWYLMNRWLQDFPYRTELGWGLFLSAGLLAFAVAALMVGGQSVRAASENLVKSLKNE